MYFSGGTVGALPVLKPIRFDMQITLIHYKMVPLQSFSWRTSVMCDMLVDSYGNVVAKMTTQYVT